MEHFEATLRIIGNAVNTIRKEEFDGLRKDCIDIISKGGKIIATGLGKNVPICEKFVGTLNSVSVPAAFMHTNTAIHGDMGMVGKNDLVIVLTKSGETSESINLVNLLKLRNCKMWLLSFTRESTLYRDIPNRLIIELEHEGDEWNLLPNNSTTLNLIILQELAVQIIKHSGIDINIFRQNHPGGAIGKSSQGYIV